MRLSIQEPILPNLLLIFNGYFFQFSLLNLAIHIRHNYFHILQTFKLNRIRKLRKTKFGTIDSRYNFSRYQSKVFAIWTSDLHIMSRLRQVPEQCFSNVYTVLHLHEYYFLSCFSFFVLNVKNSTITTLLQHLWSTPSTFYIVHALFLYKSAFFAENLLPKPKCNKRKSSRSTFVRKTRA